MGNKTEISWTDATYNHWIGCTKVGPGCDGCYAEAWNARFGGGVAVNWGPGAPRRLTSEHNRNNLERWNAERFLECNCGWRGSEKEMRKASGCPACGDGLMMMLARRRVFCSSLSDLFDNEVEQPWRDEMFAKAEACANLDLYFLTKRICNVRRMVPARWLKPGGWPKHIRLGATIVNQIEADRDITKLLELGCPNFLSMEPLLSAVDIRLGLTTPAERVRVANEVKATGGQPHFIRLRGDMLDWVIVGGESGPGARPMHPQWVRDLRDQCKAADVPFHFKQWGEWVSVSEVAGDGPHHEFPDLARVRRVGKKAAGRLLDGVEHNEFPR